jgi:hypothetical protein
MTTIRSLIVLLALALSAAACVGSGTVSPSGNLVARSPSVTAVPTASVLQIATATPPPWLVGSPTPGPPATVEIDDPDLTLTLPFGWGEYEMAMYRSLIDQYAKASSPEVQALLSIHLKAIDEGAVRMAATGFVAGANASYIIQVDSGDRSLEAAVTRIRRIEAMATGSTVVDDGPVTLAIGPAVRRVETHAVPPGEEATSVASRTVEYIARLDDGRTLWILASAPAVATTFDALIDASVATIKAR